MLWLSVRYCVRQDATAFLELWALLLALAGAAVALRSTARAWSRGLLCCAALIAAVGASIIIGCTMTGAADQGQGWDFSPAWYTPLRCMGYDALWSVNNWCSIVIFAIAGIALLQLGIVRRKTATRVFAFSGSAVLLILTLLSGFFLLFGYSWCSSSRLF